MDGIIGQETMEHWLNRKGYKINDNAFRKIKIAHDWYCNEKMPFHKKTNINGVDYELERTNFTKRLCSDDANLCEAIEITCQNTDAENKIILDHLKENNFNVMYRKQLEEMSAMGTVGCYLRVDDADVMENGDLKNGKLHINYCNGSNIIILKVDNEVIQEVAFRGTSYDRENSKSCITMFTLNDKEEYDCTTAYFDINNRLLEEFVIHLGNVKPFAIMRVAEVNNLEDMAGYGLPKIFNVVSDLQILDLTYNLWKRDLEKSDKLVFLNKNICRWNKEKQRYELPSDEMKKIFVILSEQENDADSPIYQEYNPIIRTNEIKGSLELCLSMLSMRFGFGSKKYTFENGRIVTATEYVGEHQDAMQELNRQRQESITYISDIIKFIRWYERAFNDYVLADDEIAIDFDDSYVVDKEKQRETMRNDALSFDIPSLKRLYLKEQYNLTDKEVDAWMMETKLEDDIDGTEQEE